ncbi:unnamed protein product [Linum tenue]|uniref:Oxidative stress 3 n=1 Tax=Linum tenue TaxID=586396 RepID=A0AAV0KR75_9ROSI|nr:unnamed protein product [Linum tenue]
MGATDCLNNNQDQMMLFQQLHPSSNLHHHPKNDHPTNDDYNGLSYNTGSSTSSLDNSSSSTIGSESLSSSCSASSDLIDDATSSCSSSSSSVSNLGSHGSMFELSELMATLPIKRGLSKFYQGKSQSFTSLTRVVSIEDLVKKENPYNSSNSRRKMLKGSKSYANGLDACRPYTLHKSVISKNNHNKLVSSISSFPARKGIFLSRPPIGPICVQRKI